MPPLELVPCRVQAAADGIGDGVGSTVRRFVRGVAGLIAASTLASLCWVCAAGAFTVPVTGPSNAPRMVFNNKMSVTSVCLPVTNPAGGQSLLYGQRFTDGSTSASTPAIVLVHGIASSTENWDFSSTWSVARALASAGYVVFSYDRLGYAKSSYYAQPGGGFLLSPGAPLNVARRRRGREDWRVPDRLVE